MQVAKIDETKLSEGADAFTRNQARAFEQAKIEQLGFDKDGKSKTILNNGRNEIATHSNVNKGAVKWANWMMNKGALTFAH